MRVRLVAGLGLLMIAGCAGRPADATVSVAIDLAHQRMHVISSRGHYDWPISSARSGFTTPGGSYAPTHLELMHYSKKYHMSPMPHAIFFRGGYAIHGTSSVGELGRPASHGCVRLSPGHAAALYAMVKGEGARISIGGTPPASRPFLRERTPRVFVAQRFVPRRIAMDARTKATSRRPIVVGAYPEHVMRVRSLHRPFRTYVEAPVYGYGAVYNRPPTHVYAPARAYAPYGYAYAYVPYAPYAYVSAPRVIEAPAQAPLAPYGYGE